MLAAADPSRPDHPWRMAYLLLRDDSSNASGSYRTKAEALAAMSQAIETARDPRARGCALATCAAKGGMAILAEDADLARLACARGRAAGEKARRAPVAA